jgi:rubrerythrin
MDLDRLLTRCRGFEARAAATYRAYAARTRSRPEVCAMWTALARDEDAHEHTLARAASWLEKTNGWHTSLGGWDEALDEIDERLIEAERPDIGADVDRMLLAAIALERTEIDTLFHRLLGVLQVEGGLADADAHLDHLLAMADASTNAGVKFEAALLRAHRVLIARPTNAPPERGS